jgi:DNA-binding NarL/FixJ family response regulator
MPEQRIILANGSRLLREMLNRILLKTDNIDVIQEITNQETLPTSIENADAEWVVMSLPVDGAMPEWVEPYMVDHPHMRFMAVAADGSWVKTKWLESHEEDLNNLTLKDLINILGGIVSSA